MAKACSGFTSKQFAFIRKNKVYRSVMFIPYTRRAMERCGLELGTEVCATQDGVAVIDPEKLAINVQPPPVMIESCNIDGALAAITSPLRLTPRSENVEIQYAALSLVDSERIRFKYKMQGLDRDWVNAGARRPAYYSHLPPGDYTFQVTAAHGDGVWDEKSANLSFVVLPPFYQTLAGRACYGSYRARRRTAETDRA